MSKPKITPTENGPYLIEGTDAVVRYTDGKAFPIKGKAALCRCGGSKNKPFCDGTHKSNGFTSAKDPNRVPDKLEDSEGNGITIHDNRGLCAHAGRCTDGLPVVFRLGTEPWIAATAADAETIAATIQQCPSGALSYSINDKLYRDRGGDPMVALAPNGPYVIRGGADLENTELNEGGTTDHMTLCRCGASTNKPFCSGAHWNFQFDEDAPKE
ncbi:MAG: hypothetical protein HKN21_12955 [Candidatus Eisenbacteria bacterium]|uniref:Iron-binding zinc finger CDGSH type domain-containing protein n=1 Tax=Eiseniibacteriota bacterium TaxID=2212470 RepID=A0A7Y2E9F0_UNCEI|nr:hypothetical protein [Candidatus Eisenbacteria bacterium]